ncbi:PQQ-dependent sugar dehydrogenase [Natrialba aegyptia]|nr:PQQ-dependent sugar dehydrogenase [Natrialba aegyptia]
MTTHHPDSKTLSRRLLLQATALASASGFATTALAQDDGFGNEIELGGRTSGWVGQSPEQIADEDNPTLELVPGESYTLTWENLDGAGHNFAIEGADGEENFVETEIVSGVGETQEVEFTAEEGMAEYYCQPHPTSMRGEIELAGEGGNGDEEMEAEDESQTIIGEGPTIGLETIADGLTAPLNLQVADEAQDRQFVVDQAGEIWILDDDGLADEPFLDVTDRMVELEGDFDERGLLGLAFHPDFEENGRFFVRYSAPPTDEVPDGWDHTFVLAEFETADDENSQADPDSERRILEIPEPQFNHNSGAITFGPDGCLYVATGDGGGANDVGEGHVEDWYDGNEGGNGQDTSENLLGGILRIDINSEGEDGQPYAIPEDNPLVDMDGELDEYWAWGLRNPWGISFTDDGELLVADVGQALFETVNHVEAGGNYGWNVWEGTHCFSTESPDDPPEDCPAETPSDVRGGEPLRGPVIEYPHQADMGRYGDGAAQNGDAENGDDGGNGNETDADADTDTDTENGNGNGNGEDTNATEDAEETSDDTGDIEQIGVSITGGYMYEGGSVSELEGTYVFGDWSRDGEGPGRLFLARPPEGWPNGETDGDDGADETTDENENGTDTDTDTENGGDDLHAPEEDTGNNTEENAENDSGPDFEPIDPEGNGESTDESDGAAADQNTYSPPNEVDLWPIEELGVESEDDVGSDGSMNHLVYGFGRDANGEMYVLSSDTPTLDGEGYVSRIVTADESDTAEDDGTEDEDADTETESETDADLNETETDTDTETDAAENESTANESTDA